MDKCHQVGALKSKRNDEFGACEGEDGNLKGGVPVGGQELVASVILFQDSERRVKGQSESSVYFLRAGLGGERPNVL